MNYFWPGPQDSPPPWMTSLTEPGEDDGTAAEDPAT